jgi:hypothetical protein
MIRKRDVADKTERPVKLAVLDAGLIGKRHIDGVLAEPGTALMAKRSPPEGACA